MFRIRGTRLGRLWCECDLCVFVYPFIFIQLVVLLMPLFLNEGLPPFLTVSMSCFVPSQSLLRPPSLPALHHHSLFVCLSTIFCPCSVIILFLVHPSICAVHLLLSLHSHAYMSLSIHLSVSFFSGGRADSWLVRPFHYSEVTDSISEADSVHINSRVSCQNDLEQDAEYTPAQSFQVTLGKSWLHNRVTLRFFCYII